MGEQSNMFEKYFQNSPTTVNCRILENLENWKTNNSVSLNKTFAFLIKHFYTICTSALAHVHHISKNPHCAYIIFSRAMCGAKLSP